ncbi:MAG: ATP-binding protein [Atopobiaceae bacterium]|jgi:predicted AAA+ superfamily ATPase
MKRKIAADLQSWKESSRRKPLILLGARQVGKTYSVLAFGKDSFDNVIHADFAESPDLSRLFAGDLNPKRLTSLLTERFQTRIDPERTLVFFDEVQRCPQAVTSLKYFCEQAPEYHVVAAGSLLGTTIQKREGLFPVGKVDMFEMHPLDFEEYLWALDRKGLADMIREHYDSAEAFPLHDLSLDLYRRYLLVGGMPEPLDAWVQDQDMAEVRRAQSLIATGYLADIAQYTEGLDAAKVAGVWRSIPQQLAKENAKFQYAVIRTGARRSEYAPCIEWLIDAGLVSPCRHITDAVRPLENFVEDANFKLYLLDTGILASLYQATMPDLMPQADKASRFRGAIAENYVMQQLVAAGVKAYYWGTASKSEVEFVYADQNGRVVPIEVKSGRNTSARSVRSFSEKYDIPYVLKPSTKNFGLAGGIKSIPLYAAFCIR